MNILVVAPHPDDEVLGCGGILAKYAKEGHDTYVAVMTNAHLGAPEQFTPDGVINVRNEALKAHQVLGVKETFFFDFPAPRLETTPGYEIAIALNKLIKQLAIEIMYLPHRGDMHKDHAIIFYAALVAARPINNCPVKDIYTYETLSETEWAAPFGSDVFIPNVYEDITGTFDVKVRAMECFASQIKAYPHPRSAKGLESLAVFRGCTVGVPLAESFALIRSVR
jgi:LmbE family N-acetylglucosaminyl deacetylase